MKTQKLLDEETERNRDNIAHCKALQKHYDDRVTAYEVHYSSLSYVLTINLPSLQEVKRHAGEVMKTLQAREKEEVGLQERKKHATSKVKKLMKSLQDVRAPHPLLPSFQCLICLLFVGHTHEDRSPTCCS